MENTSPKWSHSQIKTLCHLNKLWIRTRPSYSDRWNVNPYHLILPSQRLQNTKKKIRGKILLLDIKIMTKTFCLNGAYQTFILCWNKILYSKPLIVQMQKCRKNWLFLQFDIKKFQDDDVNIFDKYVFYVLTTRRICYVCGLVC